MMKFDKVPVYENETENKMVESEKEPFNDLASAIASAVTKVDDPDMQKAV